MADIEWQNETLPVSKQFDDSYYSRNDGRAETDYVFINGNDLPERWPKMQSCTIAELGFGTGLNFLQTVYQWQRHRPQNAHLHFISFEQFPISSAEMEKALSVWPELKPLGEKLQSLWNHPKRIHELSFAQDVLLSVHIGDANEELPKQKFLADAWYLDGFSPAKNPELWNEKLMGEVARHTAPDGTCATYTAAGFVRRNLQTVGFHVQKMPGHGCKREMLSGKLYI